MKVIEVINGQAIERKEISKQEQKIIVLLKRIFNKSEWPEEIQFIKGYEGGGFIIEKQTGRVLRMNIPLINDLKVMKARLSGICKKIRSSW